ncbi:hypothetical protein TNCV_3845341 [Trichonephila clavipes]|nr:hypothetical protein TNCV_3845341 [Trichonephila clavipes]
MLLFHTHTHNCEKKFLQGRSKIIEEDRIGRPILVATKSTAQQVEELIRADQTVIIGSIAMAIGCAPGLESSIMHDRLNFRKACKKIYLQMVYFLWGLSGHKGSGSVFLIEEGVAGIKMIDNKVAYLIDYCM